MKNKRSISKSKTFPFHHPPRDEELICSQFAIGMRFLESLGAGLTRFKLAFSSKLTKLSTEQRCHQMSHFHVGQPFNFKVHLYRLLSGPEYCFLVTNE